MEGIKIFITGLTKHAAVLYTAQDMDMVLFKCKNINRICIVPILKKALHTLIGVKSKFYQIYKRYHKLYVQRSFTKKSVFKHNFCK